jgi:hypothetical protein
MFQEMRLGGMYGDFVELLTLRRSEKFLRSFGKQWEAKLPTYPLIINKNNPKLRRRKNCEFVRKWDVGYNAPVNDNVDLRPNRIYQEMPNAECKRDMA